MCRKNRKNSIWRDSGLTGVDVKRARQRVVGLCRASGIHYKREKKADTNINFPTIGLSLLYAATHNIKLFLTAKVLTGRSSHTLRKKFNIRWRNQNHPPIANSNLPIMYIMLNSGKYSVNRSNYNFHYAAFSFVSVYAGHFANAITHRSIRIPPGISASSENAGLKPVRAKIFQNGTTKKIADAISQGKIPNSPM